MVRFICFACIVIMWLTACSSDEALETSVFQPLNKMERERLGNLLHLAIVSRTAPLPQLAPYDTTVIPAVEALYAQVSSPFNADPFSPKDDRWSANRPWRIIILAEDESVLYAAPGGYVYVSLGLLRELQTEHQLYAVLAQEAIAVQEGLLLTAFQRKFGTSSLRNFIYDSPNELTPTLDQLVSFLTSYQMPESDIKQIDKQLIDYICQSSAYAPTGITEILTSSDILTKWKQQRSYSGRLIWWQSQAPDDSCGDLRTLGNYQRQILQWL